MHKNHTLPALKIVNNKLNKANGWFLGVVMGKLMHTIAYQLSVGRNRWLCMMKWNEGYT